jgi:hypothetical protein
MTAQAKMRQKKDTLGSVLESDKVMAYCATGGNITIEYGHL